MSRQHLLDYSKVSFGYPWASRGGSQECPNCGAYKKSVEHVLFECASYDSQRLVFWTI